jgi:hypothetical protein
MVGTESASVRAGNWMYLFFNKNDSSKIDFWKVSEETREPQAYVIKVDDSTELSSGGAITAVYLEQKDEIHVFYINKPEEGKKHELREVCLKDAKKDSGPGKWIGGNVMTINKKGWKIHPESMLCSAVDINGNPRVFFNNLDDGLGQVHFAEYTSVGKGKDWITTKLTGLGS